METWVWINSLRRVAVATLHPRGCKLHAMGITLRTLPEVVFCSGSCSGRSDLTTTRLNSSHSFAPLLPSQFHASYRNECCCPKRHGTGSWAGGGKGGVQSTLQIEEERSKKSASSCCACLIDREKKNAPTRWKGQARSSLECNEVAKFLHNLHLIVAFPLP